MSKSIDNQSTNGVTIVGKLSDLVMREGTSKAGGKPYRSGTATIRVEQHYGGKDETSEIPVQFIAMKFKKDGTSNPAYESLSELNNYKTIQNHGYDAANRIRVNAKSGHLSENMFVGRDNEQVVSTWRIDSSFFNEVRGSQEAAPSNGDCATFSVDLFLMSIAREMTADGEETGRLKIRGGIVQYGRKLDCLDFYVEDPTAVEYIERNWSMNDTVNAVGRIRYTSETVTYHSENSWGEDIPKTSTKTKRELIITQGSDVPFDEELAYAPEDIQVMNADRNNRKEQLKIDARSRAAAKKAVPSAAAAVASSGFGWEE